MSGWGKLDGKPCPFCQSTKTMSYGWEPWLCDDFMGPACCNWWETTTKCPHVQKRVTPMICNGCRSHFKWNEVRMPLIATVEYDRTGGAA